MHAPLTLITLIGRGDEQRHNFASGYGTPAWFISIFPGFAYRPPPTVLNRLT
jgi:hypothetical protein